MAVRRDGLRLTVSALCLMTAIPAALAQSATGSNSDAGRFELRGTSDGTSSTASTAASTLYGALPAPRPGGATMATTDGFGATAPAGPLDTAANPVQPAAEDLTGSIGSPSNLSQADQDYAASLARQNARVGTVDGLPLDPLEQEAGVPGFSFGSLTLRPTLDQRVVHESVRYGPTRTSRTYSQTTLSGTLESDWSRHQLNVDGSGTWQKNLSGTGTETPSANVNARLNLDLINDITGVLGAGYSYSRESRTDPNAISGATSQAGVHELRASIGLEKNLGLLRGSTTLEVTRKLYGDATLADGTTVLLDDRDTLGAELTARIGYEVSPALVPFVEGTVGREKYDQRIDSTGAARSSKTFGARAGAEVNFGEKLSGEFAAGYVLRNLDDANLADISGLTLDGDVTWSPLRGTNVNLGLATTLESATTAGQSGAVVYELDATLSQQIRSNLVARLGATAGYRDYDSGSGRSNQRSYGASAGLTWSINRYLDLEADASYERTKEPGGTDEDTARVGLGLKLRR
ncbi:outer membrane beta-barrel protein [Hoeflea alexandrii]|uniref:outer membrane beta-barrel protein n=1 Tax=Hoeflea alexandrii TaxID=288436 RepID=UPI0022AEFA85|nr:outer membrane beta-barrel protein [Hoeflea alexandrii]